MDYDPTGFSGCIVVPLLQDRMWNGEGVRSSREREVQFCWPWSRASRAVRSGRQDFGTPLGFRDPEQTVERFPCLVGKQFVVDRALGEKLERAALSDGDLADRLKKAAHDSQENLSNPVGRYEGILSEHLLEKLPDGWVVLA